MPSKSDRSSDGDAGTLTSSVPDSAWRAKACHPLAAQRVDLLVQLASTGRDPLLRGLGVAEQALEVVVAQAREVGQRICRHVGTISLGDVDSSSPRAEGSTSA